MGCDHADGCSRIPTQIGLGADGGVLAKVCEHHAEMLESDSHLNGIVEWRDAKEWLDETFQVTRKEGEALDDFEARAAKELAAFFDERVRFAVGKVGGSLIERMSRAQFIRFYGHADRARHVREGGPPSYFEVGVGGCVPVVVERLSGIAGSSERSK